MVSWWQLKLTFPCFLSHSISVSRTSAALLVSPPAPTCTADVIYENLVIPSVSHCAGLHLTILSLPIRLERVCHLALLFLIPLYTILKDNPGQQDIYYNCPHLTVKEQRHIRLKYLAPKLSKPREEAGFSSKLLNAGSSGLACGLGKRTLDQTLR